MQKICTHCSASFEITKSDLAFYNRIEVPEPNWCPACRHLRRHGWINDLTFYPRTCDHCQKSFVSIFPPESEYIVYCQQCWYSDERDDKEQGREYDFSRPFFEQFDELMHAVPQLGIIGQNNQNSDYCESIANCKNCYLISECSNCEECYYSYWIQKTTDSFDCAYTHECERCYKILDCVGCYNVSYAQNCTQCSDSYFLEGCKGCKNCLFCTNLRNKQYYIFNKPYAKEAYFAELEKMQFGSFTAMNLLQQKFQEFLQTQSRKYLQIENTENCSGNYIHYAKNCHQVFHCYEAEDCSYGEHVWRGAKDCMDANTAGRNAELIYESTNSGINSYNVKFSRYCWGCHHTEYSNHCLQGKNLFGCVSLKPGAEYCILNKQYRPQEYRELVRRIKEQMQQISPDPSLEKRGTSPPPRRRGLRRIPEYGEFFPLQISLFGYNTTVSFWDFPFKKEEVLQKGWKWEERQSRTKGKGTIAMKTVPNTIHQTSEDICDEVLTCGTCECNYKIIPQEFTFYREQSIPLPRKCPGCRHQDRLTLRGGLKLYNSKCGECEKEIRTSYQPSLSQRVYCEQCHLENVY